MLRSIMHSESHLLNSDDSKNNGDNNQTSKVRVASTKYSTLLSTTSHLKRSNFLKVCSWPFTRIESLNELKTQTPLKCNNSIENKKSKSVEKTIGASGCFDSITNRCIVLTNLNSSMSINSVIQQVCGGPLEKIIRGENSLELYFIFPEHAKKFYIYGRATGLLICNGTKLKVDWLDDENDYNSISKYLLHDVLNYGCRRCLIVSKIIPNKKIRTGDKMFYPEPEIHYSSELNVQDIKMDFLKFGDIMDIGSVISRKLCFSIFYYDIRNAINAKNKFETDGSELNKKYKDWTIWYGKDITDRTCFVL